MLERIRKLLFDPHDYLPKKEKHDKILEELQTTRERAKKVQPYKFSRHYHEANFVGNPQLRGR